MSQTIKIELSDDTKNALNQAAGEEGLSESALIEKAVTDYLFLRQFRNLGERMISKGSGYTDQDVLDLVS